MKNLFSKIWHVSLFLLFAASVVISTACAPATEPATIVAAPTPLPQGNVRLMVTVLDYTNDNQNLDTEYEILMTGYASGSNPGEIIEVKLINGCKAIEIEASQPKQLKLKLNCLIDQLPKEFISVKYADNQYSLLRTDGGLTNQLMFHFK